MEFREARINMVKQQIHTWDVFDEQVLDMFLNIPREMYVPEAYIELAYADTAIPLGHDQTMMPPKEQARLLQNLKINSADQVLVLGITDPFLIALIANLSEHVYSVDCYVDTLMFAKQKMVQQGIVNVTFRLGDLSRGWQQDTPYDVIVLTGSVDLMPDELKRGLKINGRLFAVIGDLPAMEATLVKRESEQEWKEEKLFETVRPRLPNAPDHHPFLF